MFTRPGDVDEAHLVDLLASGWGIDVVDLSYLAVGFGSHHWRAATATDEWFVTVDDLTTKAREPGETVSLTRNRLLAALTTAVELRDRGYDFVVAPVRSRSGQVAVDFDVRYVVAVYPTLSGETYDYGAYTDPRHRDAVVGHLASLHGAPAPCRRWAMTETFSIARRSELTDAYPALRDRWDSGPFAETARQLLAEHVDAVERTFARYDALVAARSRPERFVLTHGEPHPANTVTTTDGVVLVDWDTALLAPPERDLWDLVGQDASVVEQYQSITGVAVDPGAVELYRLAWDLTEIAIYISDNFRRPHERTDDTAEAWKNLRHFLDPSRWRRALVLAAMLFGDGSALFCGGGSASVGGDVSLG